MITKIWQIAGPNNYKCFDSALTNSTARKERLLLAKYSASALENRYLNQFGATNPQRGTSTLENQTRQRACYLIYS